MKIFYTGENLAPDFNQCDYAISACRMDYCGRNLYLPPCFLACREGSGATLPAVEPEMAHRPFCSFIYSQDSVGEGSRRRKEFCRRLMDVYAHVACPGRMLHNTDAPELAARGDVANWSRSKVAYISQFKFNIAFENSNADGYITEKLTDCFLGNTVPIYYGAATSRLRRTHGNSGMRRACTAWHAGQARLRCACATCWHASPAPIARTGTRLKTPCATSSSCTAESTLRP